MRYAICLRVVAIFVVPFCVVMAWMMGEPLDLYFKLYETSTLFITVITVSFIIQV